MWRQIQVGCVEIRDFRPVSHYITEMVQERDIAKANKNSHTLYRMALFLDFELPFISS